MSVFLDSLPVFSMSCNTFASDVAKYMMRSTGGQQNAPKLSVSKAPCGLPPVNFAWTQSKSHKPSRHQVALESIFLSSVPWGKNIEKHVDFVNGEMDNITDFTY